MKQKHKEYLDLLKLLRDENLFMRSDDKITQVMNDYLEGKVMAYERAISIFTTAFTDELTKESE